MSPRNFHPPGSPSRSALRWRMQRGCFNANRLRYEASILASVHGAICLGYDGELSDLLNNAGLGNDAVSTVRFRGFAGEVGVILPTDRTWNQPRLLETAFDVGSKASSVAKTVMIVPPADIRRQPRLGNSQTLFHDKTVPAYGDADTAKAYINAKGGQALLLECAAALGGPDARERVFGLVYGGQLTLDLTETLNNRSIVGLVQPHTPRLWDALGWKTIQAT